jgi:hypothetical protein
MGIQELLGMVKEYGLTMVLLIYFIFMYVKNNKDTLGLIISFKDESNKIHTAHVDAIYVLKDEIKGEVSSSIKEHETSMKAEFCRVEDKLGKTDERVGRVEMLLIVKRGEDK